MESNLRILGNVTFQEAAFYPLTDAHMHIQGNDIAPIPIMNGVMYININLRKQVKLILGKCINFDELSYTKKMIHDVTPGILAGQGLKDVVRLFSSKEGERERLTDLTAAVKEYGKVCRHTSYLIAGIYMNDLIKSTMGIQSRSIKKDSKTTPQQESEKERNELIELRIKTTSEFSRATMHYYGQNAGSITGLKSAGFEFSLCMGMELMYAHYWGAYGIPIYIPINGKLYFPINELDYIVRSFEGKTGLLFLHNAYDLPKKDILDVFDVWEDGKRKEILRSTPNKSWEKRVEGLSIAKAFPANELGISERYCHFLSEVDATEAVQFEDHIKHVKYMKVAALKYPFKLLPFYHLDARRFFSTKNITSLGRYHDFYIQKGMRLDKVPIDTITKAIQGKDPFTYKMSEQDVKKELLQNGGLFWGIKMYVALGYPPYIGDAAMTKRVFPALHADDYLGFIKFLSYCASNDIPITCHGSPQGMTIADPGIYLKEFLKQQPTSEYMKHQYAHFPIDDKGFCNGLGLIDSFSSPESWKYVLDRLVGGKKLRICLAHFGGMGFMNGDIDVKKSPYVWMRDISDLIQKNGQMVFTDLSCYTFGSCELPYILAAEQYTSLLKYNIISAIYNCDVSTGVYIRCENYQQKITNVKEMKQLLDLRIEMLEKGYCEDSKKIANTAETLKTLINKYPKLRYRIMFGTDWPMTETSVRGVSIYNSSMFLMLQLLTRKLSNSWDAWHQFAVINPLRFLGLLNEDSDTAEAYTIKIDKLKKMKESLKKMNKNTDVINRKNREMVWNLSNSDQVDEGINDAYDFLAKKYDKKSYKIPAAHKMRNKDGELGITLAK